MRNIANFFSAVILFSVALLIAVSIPAYYGFVLSVLWGWYGLPLTGLNLNWIEFSGIAILLLFCSKIFIGIYNTSFDKKKTLQVFTTPAVFLFIGWIYKVVLF